MSSQASPSPALQAANARLLSLRARLQVEQMASPVLLPTPPTPSQGVPPPGDDMGQNGRRTAVAPLAEGQTVCAANEANTAVLPGMAEGRAATGGAGVLPDLLAALPPHLGWGSTAVTAHLRHTHVAPDSLDETAVAPTPLTSTLHSTLPSSHSAIHTPHSAISLPPSLALALLRQGRVAEGRLWLLLRWLDGDGRGWLERAAIFAACTDKTSPTYLCTPRYLRELLAAGDGLFWQQDSATGKACPELAERVWLRGQVKVAAGLGVRRAQGRNVEMPVAILFAPIGQVRAHLYASFHSGRGETAAPISRETLRNLSGASPRAQQGYEQRARVQAQGCVAVGAAVTAVSDPQEHAWQHGRAAFTITDHGGITAARGTFTRRGACRTGTLARTSRGRNHADSTPGWQSCVIKGTRGTAIQGTGSGRPLAAVAGRITNGGRGGTTRTGRRRRGGGAGPGGGRGRIGRGAVRDKVSGAACWCGTNCPLAAIDGRGWAEQSCGG